MPQKIVCRDCGTSFTIAAGVVSVDCPGCGKTIRLAGRSKSPRRRSSGKRPGSTPIPSEYKYLIAGVVVSVTAFVLIVAQVSNRVKQHRHQLQQQQQQADGAPGEQPVGGGSASGGGSGTSPIAIGGAKDREQLRLDRDRERYANIPRQRLISQHGPDIVATIYISNLKGPEDELDYFLTRRLRDTLDHYYQQAVEEATVKNEPARKAAEQQAIAKAKNSTFPSPLVRYTYNAVPPKWPAPEVAEAIKVPGTFRYHIVPVPDLEDFGRRLDIGEVTKIDEKNRAIYVKSSLPDEVPDYDREQMQIAFGRDKVITVLVHGAQGKPNDVFEYLQNRLHDALESSSGAGTIMGRKRSTPGEYRFNVGPISDIEYFASQVSFGECSVNHNRLIVDVAAKLPEKIPEVPDIPSPPPPTVAKMKAEYEKDLERRQKRVSKTNDLAQRSDEDDISWTIRMLTYGGPFEKTKAIDSLSTLTVPDDRVEPLVEAIKSCLRTTNLSSSDEKQLTGALQRLSPDGHMIVMTERLHSGNTFQKRDVINQLAATGKKEAAEAIVPHINDFFLGETAINALGQMGEVAEEPLIIRLTDPDPEVRMIVCALLARVGTEKCIPHLKRQASDRQKNPKIRNVATASLRQLRARLSTDSDSDEPN